MRNEENIGYDTEDVDFVDVEQEEVRIIKFKDDVIKEVRALVKE